MFFPPIQSGLGRVLNPLARKVELKLSFLDSLLPRCKKLAVWIAAGLLFYTVLGCFFLPPIARVIAVKQLSKRLDRSVTIVRVRFNPYTFSVTIRGLLIKDKDGATLLSLDEGYVDFQLASVFTHAWVFKEVSLASKSVIRPRNKLHRHAERALGNMRGGFGAFQRGQQRSA